MGTPAVEVLVFALAAVVCAAVTVSSARRLARVVRTLRHGARAEGRCVRVRSEPYNRSDAARYFFAFQTADGSTVEFEDMAKWSMGVGDRVTVTYDPRDPRRTATTAGRGSFSPVVQHLALVAGCGAGTAVFTALVLVRLLGGS
ncbi:DUF3592 domain-containing protein [Streptomyces sp. TS71-3]|uniref:DUF3592 domain-containing protein n=1 Tax=Streptomyces sp. TS71-3 TaxID=2733862 RepID=UPI001B236761|nr:DUF3592 domain-containing protein [Streptomyces sp. TS71-3]GHJ35342.1 hypothetical protein Sm713_09510 [Streptomyces sp. TS71-3]